MSERETHTEKARETEIEEGKMKKERRVRENESERETPSKGNRERGEKMERQEKKGTEKREEKERRVMNMFMTWKDKEEERLWTAIANVHIRDVKTYCKHWNGQVSLGD